MEGEFLKLPGLAGEIRIRNVIAPIEGSTESELSIGGVVTFVRQQEVGTKNRM